MTALTSGFHNYTEEHSIQKCLIREKLQQIKRNPGIWRWPSHVQGALWNAGHDPIKT